MAPKTSKSLTGRCACGSIRYKLGGPPMIVNACHCRDCQRITGAAFAINIWIEHDLVKVSGSKPKSFTMKGGTGKPHEVFFCGKCGTYLWNKYRATPGDFLFVRAGTLDSPEMVAPDAHIFTRSKLPWLKLPEGVPTFESYYKMNEVWSPESLERFRRAVAR